MSIQIGVILESILMRLGDKLDVVLVPAQHEV
jgi:hypothetical protein